MKTLVLFLVTILGTIGFLRYRDHVAEENARTHTQALAMVAEMRASLRCRRS